VLIFPFLNIDANAVETSSLYRLRRLFLATTLLLTGCTAHYPINEPLTVVDYTGGYQNTMVTRGDRSNSLAVALAFSGGGTRAAAFSYGLLRAMGEITINWEGKQLRLLDEIDTISAVSGGSFTAAYYGLFGDRIFADYEEKFLRRNVEGKLKRSLWAPWNWFKYSSPYYGRSEYAAEYYDEILFEGKTFGDILARNGPFIQINASDISLGTQFSFAQDLFNLLCSDVSKFPISRAVAASSAVPVLFSSVTIHNYAQDCDYRLPSWLEDALEEQDRDSLRYRLAHKYIKYLDKDARPYLHLYDGGLTDNLGVRPFITRFSLAGGAWELMKIMCTVDVRRTFFIVVNAKAELKASYSQLANSVPLLASITSATAIPLNEYSYETMRTLRSLLKGFDKDIAEGRCNDRKKAGLPLAGCDDIQHYLVEINIEHLQDKIMRDRLLQLPTSFKLEADDVDALVDAAREILVNSKEFQRFLHDMQ